MEERWRELIRRTLSVESYRDFLIEALNLYAELSPRFSNAAFTRKAGFTSRSFVKEVLTGQKRITPKSYPGFLKALDLPQQLQTYFEFLVKLEEDDVNHEGTSTPEIHQKLREIRQKLSSKIIEKSIEKKNGAVLFHDPAISEVFALIGNREAGIEFQELHQQSQMQAAPLRRIVDVLKNYEIIEEVEFKLRARVNLHNEYGVGEDHPLKSSFIKLLDEAKGRAQTQFASPENLYLQAVFSVDRRKMPELKAKLRAVLQEFVEGHIEEEANSTTKLVVGLFN